MITRDEIDGMASSLGVHPVSVERDYVMGWVLAAIFGERLVSTPLLLKGGNALRKAYFPDTRYSGDLDFATEGPVNRQNLQAELSAVCRFVEARTAVRFDADRTLVRAKRHVDADLSVCEARLYFHDSYGEPGQVVISARMDVTEFERLFLDPLDRPLFHPYSDASACSTTVRCLRLEEILASKLKCLLQRRHFADLYDLAHWIFFRSEDVDRAATLRIFLKKTIYEPDAGAAAELLTRLPFEKLRSVWGTYITCASRFLLRFEDAVERFVQTIAAWFPNARGRSGLSFFPSALRNPLLEAGSAKTLVRLRYRGLERLVEPYSLRFKRTKDGRAGEYLYVHDRTGGRSGQVGTKALVADGIERIENTDEVFEPRYAIELCKAGEPQERDDFRRSRLPEVLRASRTHRRRRR